MVSGSCRRCGDKVRGMEVEMMGWEEESGFDWDGNVTTYIFWY